MIADDPSAHPATEAPLLDRLRSGDAAAFEEMVRVHSPRLLVVARRILRGEDAARDALQDAFLSAFKALAGFGGNAQLATWLHRIVVNAALMQLRRRRRRPEEGIDHLLPAFDASGRHSVGISDWNEPPDRSAERAETRAVVRQAIDRLPDSYRMVLILRDVEEWSTRETAAALGLSPNAAKLRLHRARQALRAQLAASFDARSPDSAALSNARRLVVGKRSPRAARDAGIPQLQPLASASA